VFVLQSYANPSDPKPVLIKIKLSEKAAIEPKHKYLA